jgi:hypothetical protein
MVIQSVKIVNKEVKTVIEFFDNLSEFHHFIMLMQPGEATEIVYTENDKGIIIKSELIKYNYSFGLPEKDV